MKHLRNFFEQPIHPSRIFYAAIWGIIVGIVGGLSFNLGFFAHFLWLVAAFLVFAFALRHASCAFLMLAFFSGIIFGNFRICPELASRNYFTNLVGETIILSGKISEDPISASGQTKLRLGELRLHHFSPDENAKNSTMNGRSYEPSFSYAGMAYVTLADSRSQLERSDEIIIQGKVGAGFGIFVTTFYRAELKSITRAEVGDVFARLKNWFAGRVRFLLAPPTADLGLGYLVGMKSSLPENLSAALSAVGMTHVIVASGAHLGILVSAAKKLFGKLSKFSGLFFSLLLILAFVLIVGFTPSMTRAALVTSLSLSVGFVGRKFTPIRLLSLVATLTLIFVPENFLNLGWQLSFASFFGILILAPRCQKFLYGGKNPPWLAGMLITSLATTLVCAPILIYNFGALSFLSLVANLIILPTLPHAMFLVFATGVFSFSAAIAQIFAHLATLLLNFHIFIINFLSEKTMFILDLPSADPRIYLLYLPILLCLILPHLRRNKHIFQ